MTSSFLLLRRSPKRLTFRSSLFYTAATPKPTSKPKTLNPYTLSTPTFTTKPKPSLVPFQPKVANSFRLTGHVTAPIHVTTSSETGAVWAFTVLSSTANSLRVSIVFEGELAHVARLHVKNGDCVFVSGSLRSDLRHLNDDKMEAARLQSNGELRIIDDSTPDWIQHKLDSMTFGPKPVAPMSDGNSTSREDGNSTVGTWKDLLDNSKQWKDYRNQKLNKLVKEKHPDFKRKDGDHALWLSKAPEWFLSELKGKEFEVPVVKSKQANDGRGDKSWRDLVENPDKWWDNRLQKRNTKAPDFKHKETGEALWLNSSPGWAIPMLPPLKTQQIATN